MINTPPGGEPTRVGLFLVPGFSMIAFSAAVEPLRLANRVAGRSIYTWECYSIDGMPVEASNGLGAMVHGAIGDIASLPVLVICGGIGAEHYRNAALYAKLRRLASHGTIVGAVCTGTYLLARAGLLDGYRCTIHWENIDGFREEFPDIEMVSELYEIDRNRFTCSGGTAAIDMMLNFIALHLGHDIAASVADQLIHHRIRGGYEGQRMELRARLNITNTKLLEAIEEMESSLEEPMSCADLARSVGLSPRQLERLFSKYFNRSPTRYYLGLRLDRARFLLLQTSLSILNVALACGFVSASHFSKCYREYFGWTPSDERRSSNASRADTAISLLTWPDALPGTPGLAAAPRETETGPTHH
jgi:transcriptional regulator GlxA family with amidase domain